MFENQQIFKYQKNLSWTNFHDDLKMCQYSTLTVKLWFY